VQDYSRVSAGKTLFELNKVKYNENILTKLIERKNEIFKHLLDNLTSKDAYPGIIKLLDDIKKQGYLLACSSVSANAVKQLKKMKLFNKFDYVVDYNSKDIALLSQREKQDLLNPVHIVLKELKLDGSECIGFENSIVGIEQYRTLNVFSVLVNNENEKVREIADFYVKFSGETPLEEIIFNYYKQHAEDVDKN
jgi:beta-phosphoglucomutase